MGVPPDLARSTLGLTTGRSTTLEDVEEAADLIAHGAGHK
jgi:cysteine sulfinate desulfinase/cysteine desulfurase-like protein